MIRPNVPPKFETPPLTEKAKHYIQLSFDECEGLTERDILCPHCKKHILGQVFSDARGHQRFKCKKCKAETIINVAYFRKVKKRKTPHRNYFGRLIPKNEDLI